MVYRVFVEKKKGLDNEAQSVYNELKNLLGIKGLKSVRLFNRYDVENLSKEQFDQAVKTVFSEPQLDDFYYELPKINGKVFAVCYLAGQFDQRADSGEQCIRISSLGVSPVVRTAKVYALSGDLSEEDIANAKKYLINPVDSREADMEKPETLSANYRIPAKVDTVKGFTAMDGNALKNFIAEKGLAMDLSDAVFCRDYFLSEKRDPTITEIKVIDTYWSDHCRHTTFLTTIDGVKFNDPVLQNAYNEYLAGRKEVERSKSVNLMDIGTLAAKVLKKRGLLDKLDESEEINACTVNIEIERNGVKEPWLLLFKNETHNHPTEIEPFGGAATCIGGAIRDPLSGRAYVYAAMRVTGAADPTVPVSETLKGKLPQRKICQTAAAGYSSYGNQIGLATGIVDEVYNAGYAAKRMEIGAVIAAAPKENVKRERPENGDVVILLGGRTGRDGIGGATGSSKAHNLKSVENCGAEVQKGNAPEERKLQRLFRNPKVAKMIKRCNDFGAGGVSVAVGELADGLDINLDAVPKKYEGLDGTELAISESQERMAVVVDKKDVNAFLALAKKENTEGTVIATVTDAARLKMFWKGETIVDISREFLNSNGAEKHITVETESPLCYDKPTATDFKAEYLKLVSDLNVCDKRGLSERFDSTIGAGTVLMPFGGKTQRTPVQAMVNKISTETGDTDDCSFMAWGYNPDIFVKSPYHGAYLSVTESIAKLAASGADLSDVYLTFQEYFEKPFLNPKRWGKPFAALLGAYKAQMDYGVAAIGGKDSMSGSFENIDVPPTLVSFAVTTGKIKNVVSNDFKAAGHKVRVLFPEKDENGLPTAKSVKGNAAAVFALNKQNKIYSAFTPTFGGIAEGVFKACLGNDFGFKFSDGVKLNDIFGYNYGALVVETDEEIGVPLGEVTADGKITLGKSKAGISELFTAYRAKLESVYPTLEEKEYAKTQTFSYENKEFYVPKDFCAKPKFLIPVFYGTNCEYDTAKEVVRAGGEADIFVVNNMSKADIEKSVEDFAIKARSAQAIFIPGGFSGGDEPDGSGKFIMAFMRNAAVKEEIRNLLNKRDGLMAGVCNGFQALIKLGLVPYGDIVDTDENSPTLTFNTIGRHQSRLVRTRVASNKSPWLKEVNVGDVFTVPISHGEGRFLASKKLIKELAANGQIATQYVDFDENATMDIRFNPNGSAYAIEGITSKDGRVLGKMGHSERIGKGLYKNVAGNYDIKLFLSAVKYFKGK